MERNWFHYSRSDQSEVYKGRWGVLLLTRLEQLEG